VANHYRVSPKFHLWARRRGLSDSETRLAFYLLTCEHRNLEGLYRLPKPYMAADLNWALEKVDGNLAAVLATGFAMYDEDAEMVLIPKALKHQSPSSPLQIRGAIVQLQRIPRTSLWHAFVTACATHCPRLAEAVEKEWPSDGHRIDLRPTAKSTDANGIGNGSAPDANGVLACVRGDSISSSNSISSSSPPNPPEQAQGGEDQPSGASPVRLNSRALGTSPRQMDAAALADQDAAAALAAVGTLTDPGDKHRKGWEALRVGLRAALPEDASAWGLYVEGLELAAVDGDVLVIDGPDRSWAWHQSARLVALTAERTGVRARLATREEHEGLRDAHTPAREAVAS
jgi:hypothetical protein